MIAPGKSYLKIRIAIKAGFAPVVQQGRFAQAGVDSRGVGLLVDPFLETFPDTHEAFVGDVDDNLIMKGHCFTGHNKGTAGWAVGVDDFQQFVALMPGYFINVS